MVSESWFCAPQAANPVGAPQAANPVGAPQAANPVGAPQAVNPVGALQAANPARVAVFLKHERVILLENRYESVIQTSQRVRLRLSRSNSKVC